MNGAEDDMEFGTGHPTIQAPTQACRARRLDNDMGWESNSAVTPGADVVGRNKHPSSICRVDANQASVLLAPVLCTLSAPYADTGKIQEKKCLLRLSPLWTCASIFPAMERLLHFVVEGIIIQDSQARNRQPDDYFQCGFMRLH